MTVSEDFVFALVMLAVGLAIIAIGAIMAYRQKNYYDPNTGAVLTEVDVPLLGKLKTNFPAAVLCFIGLIPAALASNQMTGRNPTFMMVEGEIALDPAAGSEISAIMVGITSTPFSQTTTPNGTLQLNVAIPVPNSWSNYTAYAFALDGPRTRPVIRGVNPKEKFQLRIAP